LDRAIAEIEEVANDGEPTPGIRIRNDLLRYNYYRAVKRDGTTKLQ
jgi:hypothetical protein